MDRTELLTLIPAYAIGALDHDDRVEVESWLQTDPEAQAILAEYRAVADQLVTLAPLRRAPDHLQADLRQRLAASRKTAPAVEETPAPPVAVRRWFPRRARVVLSAAAIFAVIIVGLVIVQIVSAPEPAPTGAADLYTRLVAEQNVSRYAVVPGEVTDSLWGDIVVSHDGSQAVMRVGDLPAIGEDQVFQMWLIDASGTRTSGGLFQGHDSQTVFVVVPLAQPVSAYKGVGVSLEPVGGSPYADRPTGPRVLSVPLS